MVITVIMLTTIKNVLRKVFSPIFGIKEVKSEISSTEAKTIYHKEQPKEEYIIKSIWDFIQLLPNTQAYHLVKVIGFEEWVSMDEIRRRIKELFGVEYKNERSLYPYIKTLVDCGLFETSNIGGKKRWRKKEILITVKKKPKEKEKILAVSKGPEISSKDRNKDSNADTNSTA